MKITFFFLSIVAVYACDGPVEKKQQQITSSAQYEENESDSLIISQSKQFKRLIEFLNWYKNHHEDLYMPNIVKYQEEGSSHDAYVDAEAAQELLIRYRKSGFFSDIRLEKDSLYIEEAKEAYKDKDLEVYDYFNHDRILLTQEVKGTLAAIPNTYILPSYCLLDSGQIAVSIDGFMNLQYTLIKEDGSFKILDIENLGIIK